MGNNLACISQATSASWASAGEFATQRYTYVDDPSLDLQNGRVCFNFCTTEYTGARYLYENQQNPNSVTGVECYCFDNEVKPSDLVVSRTFDGECVAGDAKYIKRSTTFDGLACLTFGGTNSDVFMVSTIPECFRQCRGFSGASVIPSTTDETYQCYCEYDFELFQTPIANCQRGIVASFSHGDYPQSSGLARRSLRERKAERAHARRLAKGGDMEFCPAGLTACKVAAGLHSGYECVDTLSELEACGGCPLGLYGVSGVYNKSPAADCTAMEGTPLGGSTCRKGKCIAMACDEGYHLHHGRCRLD